MAHELETFSNGRAAFVGTRNPAWHNLGTITAEAKTSEEALELAILNWHVDKWPLMALMPLPLYGQYGYDPEGEGEVLATDAYAIVRDHPINGLEVLHAGVSDRYECIQNADAFRITEDIVAQSGALWDTAGSMKGGRVVFMSMKMPAVIDVGGVDPMDLYLLCNTSHDGTGALRFYVTTIQTVCANTNRMAIQNAKSSWSIRHTASANSRMEDARHALGLTFKYAKAFEEEATRLLHTPYDLDKFVHMIDKLTPMPKDATDEQKIVVDAQRTAMRGLWSAPTQANKAGTAWAAVSAVTEYADWFVPVRSATAERETLVRASRIMTGANDALKQAAWDYVTAA